MIEKRPFDSKSKTTSGCTNSLDEFFLKKKYFKEIADLSSHSAFSVLDRDK